MGGGEDDVEVGEEDDEDDDEKEDVKDDVEREDVKDDVEIAEEEAGSEEESARLRDSFLCSLCPLRPASDLCWDKLAHALSFH